jgi:16S rRNA (guanine(966)-N(2))-methyltransferase RsmD
MQKKAHIKSSLKPMAKRSTAKGSPHQVRIIGGQWKRTPLPVLDAEGLRPTPDRVRETVFNWLTHLLDGEWHSVACLDLFAGSGALGFEAASRGAERVAMVESNTQAVRQLEATKEKLQAQQVTIMRGDAVSIAQNLAARGAGASSGFHLIFLDPPYHQDWLAKLAPICERLLLPGGLIYAESEQPLDGETPPEWLSGWEVVRADKAGMVFYHLLQRKLAA